MKDGETRSDSFVTFVGEMTIINAVSVAQKMLSDNILQINIYQSEYDNLDIHNGKGGGGADPIMPVTDFYKIFPVNSKVNVNKYSINLLNKLYLKQSITLDKTSMSKWNTKCSILSRT